MPPKESDSEDDEKDLDRDDESVDDKEKDKDLKVRKTPEELTQRLVETSAEAKKYRKRNAELAAQLDDERKKREDIESDKMKEQGKYKELADSKEKEANEWKEKATNKDKIYAWKVISSSVKAEASKLGCLNPDHLVKLLDLTDLDVDDDYEIKPESLKALMDQARKDMPYLFKKKSDKIVDGTPVGDDKEEPNKEAAYIKELTAAKTQRELDAVRTKYGRA